MRPGIFLLLLLVACRAKPEAAPAPAPPPSASPGVPEVDAGAPACRPLAVVPFATCGTTVVKSPPPDIEDPAGSLASFWARLAELERGTARKRVRIGMYGDSNLTSDFLSGHLRRVLQARYGDAGHGWISLSRPWGSYRHEDVVTAGFWPMFKLYAPTTHVARDRQYGFANMAAESSEIGAAAWASTAKEKAAVGKAVAHFELHYLKQPRGGTMTVKVDRKDVRTVSTRADAFELGIEELDVEDGPHELRAEVRGDGPVRLFGTSLDRSPAPDRPGIQLDSLGAGALNFQCADLVAKDTRKAGLEKRDYDLVVLWLGMNVMFVPPNRAFAKELLDDLRAALPHTPILMLSPPDTVTGSETHSSKRIVAVIDQLRELAQAEKVAFWDFRQAMGGDGASIAFTRRGLTGEDHIHFGVEGSKLMGDRLLCSASRAFAAWAADHACDQSAP